MASIGSLTADLNLRSAAFLREMKSSRAALQSNTARMRASMRHLETASRRVERQFAGLKSAAGALAGALAVRQFSRFAKSAIESADAIAKTSDQLGIATDTLQEYRIAAGLAGVSTAKVDKGLGGFAKRLGELRAGTGSLLTLLDKTNQSLKSQLVAAGSTAEALSVLLRAMAGTANQADRLALSAAAFGRGAGIAFVNLVKNGAGEVEALRARLAGLGLIMSEGVLRAAERLNDSLGLLNRAFRVGFDTAIIVGLTGSIKATEQSLKQARDLGVRFGQAVGAAMRGVAAAAELAARNLRAITAALAGLIALKAAVIFFGIATAVTRFAIALVTAARAANLLQLVMSKSVLGVIAKLAIVVGAAAIAWDTFDNEINDASKAVRQGTAELRELLDAEARFRGGFGRFDAAAAFDGLAASAGRAGAAVAAVPKEIDAAAEAVDDAKLAFGSFAETAIGDIRSVGGALRFLEERLLAIATRALISRPIEGFLDRQLSGAFSGGGLFGLFGGAHAAAEGLSGIGFQHGGRFKVPGAGGPDSQLVPLRLTPGEVVTVETPAQARAGDGGSWTVNINIDTPDLSPENRNAVAARIGDELARARARFR